MPVAVLYNDNKWYRGEILEIVPEKLIFHILFVDFGEILEVHYSNVRYLKREYLCDEVATFKCRLFGIGFKDEETYNQVLKNLFLLDYRFILLISY